MPSRSTQINQFGCQKAGLRKYAHPGLWEGFADTHLHSDIQFVSGCSRVHE